MIHDVTGRRWIMAEGLATRSSRGHRTICLPIAEEAYRHVVNDPVAFRRWIDDCFREAPELFPADFARGYELKDGRMSVKRGPRSGGSSRGTRPPTASGPRSSCPT